VEACPNTVVLDTKEETGLLASKMHPFWSNVLH
jgi:hypothetical protein